MARPPKEDVIRCEGIWKIFGEKSRITTAGWPRRAKLRSSLKEDGALHSRSFATQRPVSISARPSEIQARATWDGWNK